MFFSVTIKSYMYMHFLSRLIEKFYLVEKQKK